MDQQRVAAGSNNMPSMRRSSSINLSCHFKSVCPSPDQPSPTLRYRSLLLVSLEWPNRHLLADTAQQEDSVVGVGCIRPAWSAAHVLRPAVRPSALHPSGVHYVRVHQRTAEKRLRRRHQGPLNRPSTLHGNSLGLCHGTGGHPPGGSRDRGAHLDQGTGTLAERVEEARKIKSVGRELIRVSSFNFSPSFASKFNPKNGRPP